MKRTLKIVGAVFATAVMETRLREPPDIGRIQRPDQGMLGGTAEHGPGDDVHVLAGEPFP